MAKKRVIRKKRLKNEKRFPFFFYLFAHSSLMIANILLKNFKVCWETPPIEKPIDLHYKSIDWFPYKTSPQCKVFPKRK